MSFFQKSVIPKRPTLNRDQILSFEEVSKFVIWFILNEPFVNTLSNRIFNDGYRPKTGTQNNPESFAQQIKTLPEWFGIKIFIDLNYLKNADESEFKQFIDILDEAGEETLITGGEIAIRYNLNFQNFEYEKEIEKIPLGFEREKFKINLLNDNVYGAEIRILAWLFHEYFGKWYKNKEIN